MTKRKLFGKYDILLLAGIAILAVLLYAFNYLSGRGAAVGIISVNGELVMTVDLSRGAEIVLPQNPGIRFAVKDGAIAFIESDCPDKTCVRSGFLRRPGQMAACLPNRVTLTVSGSGGMDAMAG